MQQNLIHSQTEHRHLHLKINKNVHYHGDPCFGNVYHISRAKNERSFITTEKKTQVSSKHFSTMFTLRDVSYVLKIAQSS